MNSLPSLLYFFFTSILVLLLHCNYETVAHLLCRNCGHMVTTASALKNASSPLALDHYMIEVLGRHTEVQVFQNPVLEKFRVITVDGADLKFSGKSYAADSWFPAFRWTACVCSQCSSHMGWYFESPKEDFVGLVLDYLITSNYANKMTLVPQPMPSGGEL